jgi:hypothetical protein
MSYGAVPVVIADGGQPEIVDSDAGVLWRDVSELVTASVGLMNDDARRATLARSAVAAAARFSSAAFAARVAALAEQVMRP